VINMAKRHLKKLAAPKTWPIKRKDRTFITRPYPGSHSLSMGISLSTVMRDLIKCANTKKEIKSILHDKDLLVDGRKRDDKHMVGLMDVVVIKDTNEHYRMLLDDKGKIAAFKIDASEASLKPSKIICKTKLKKGLTQLNMSDSRNLIVKDDTYKVGDSLLLSVPDQKVKDHLKLENGAYVFLTGGKHIGEAGTVMNIEGKIIKVKLKEGAFETSKEYAFVIGKEKPSISLGKQ